MVSVDVSHLNKARGRVYHQLTTSMSGYGTAFRGLDGVRVPQIMPAHRHMAFAQCTREDLFVTKKVARKVLALPLHSNMKPMCVSVL